MEIFERDVEYKREELLRYVGSRQTQSGVIWGSLQRDVVICTTGGRHGRKAGYADKQLADGSWHYFGQGTKGSQSIQRAANARLAKPSTTLLLFSCREPTSEEVKELNSYAKLYRYIGTFFVAEVANVIPRAGKRKGNSLLRFHLASLESGGSAELDSTLSADKLELRTWIVRELNSAPTQALGIQRYWLRCRALTVYALKRAEGNCEACEQPAPFHRPDRSPFLEVHHLTRLADMGPDLPENVASLCPNCHRRVHFSLDGATFNDSIRGKILEKELALQNFAG